MIRVILKGGLGNQMFQYAFGKTVALEKGQDLQLDTCFLDCRIPVKDFTVRNYDLDLFQVSETLAHKKNTTFVSKYISYPWRKILGKFDSGYIVEGDNPYFFDEELVKRVLDSRRDITLEGYWNNYKYFESHKAEISQIFNTEKLYDPRYEKLEAMIKDTNSVSVSIRRGDYLNPKHKNVFAYLDKDYYIKATQEIRARVENPKFFVFSYDDPEWIKSQMEFSEEELVIVGKEFVGERFRTYLRLTSICKHNIISNSTFAFWGAWLNKNVDKVCIGPLKWQTRPLEFDYPVGWFGV